jgi:hypothetical protein
MPPEPGDKQPVARHPHVSQHPDSQQLLHNEMPKQ